MNRIKVERAIAGLTERQKHVQTNSDIDKDISTAIEALKTQLSQEGTTFVLNNQVNLCDSCTYTYPECPSEKDDVIFGNGIGNDNICACNKYQPTVQPVATDTNVGDKISRQQAIELIKNYCENGCDIAEDNWCPSCQREQFIKLLKALPTVQPEPHWIPVSERLPEKGGEYLVSVHHTIGAISVFHPEKDTYVDDVAIMKYYGKFPSTVRAWMPMPEAYKEGGERI